MAAAGASDVFGLTEAEAAQRLASDGPNELPTARPRNVAQQARDVLRESMLLLLVGAGVLYSRAGRTARRRHLDVLRRRRDRLSLYQGHKTENALTALRNLSAPRALVIRDGRQHRIPGRDVVRGDVTVLAEGDRVPVDGVLIDCINLTVDESALTGEAIPVRKRATRPDTATPPMGEPGGDATPWVFCGTLVVKGRGIATVVNTGANTALGRIGKALREIEPARTALQRELGRFVRIIAIAGTVAAAVVVVRVRESPVTTGSKGCSSPSARPWPCCPRRYPSCSRCSSRWALGACRSATSSPAARRPSKARIGHGDLRRQDRHPHAELADWGPPRTAVPGVPSSDYRRAGRLSSWPSEVGDTGLDPMTSTV